MKKIFLVKTAMKRCRAQRVQRHIACDPQFTCFKPAGVSRNELEKIELLVDEYEAMRLADIENMNMKQGAEKMKISAPTFNRLLNSAHKKIADAIVHGKGIRVYTKKEKIGTPHQDF